MKELHLADESLFWYWISERHSIYLKRQHGDKKPWTADPILRDYKFTNPFRENDRGTVWLRENFLAPHRDEKDFIGLPVLGTGNLTLIAGNICWYRMFNWWVTGELLGWQTEWDRAAIKAKLNQAMGQGKQVFTGAHIVYSPPGLGKIEAITDVCGALWNLAPDIVHQAETTKRLERVYDLLKTVYCVGGFMAYEMVSDMRHTRLLEDATDIMTWANPGPGAKRGLQRLGQPYKRDEDAILSMRALLAKCPKEFFDLSVYPILEMRDIEHSLCEFDKYCRVKFGEGEPRSKYNGIV